MGTKNQRKNQEERQCTCSQLNCNIELLKFDDLLLHFTKCGNFSPDFEKRIALQHPEEFIRAVCCSKSFLKNDRYSFLQELPLPESLCVHQQVWKLFYERECHYREKLTTEFDKYLNDLPLTPEQAFWKAFCDITCWMEMYRDKYEGMNDVTMQHLCEIYAWFMEYLLRKDKFKCLHLSGKGKELFFQYMGGIAPSREDWFKENQLFPLILKYISFHRDLVDLYCYDTTVTPQMIHENLYLIQSPYDFYRWRLNGVRYLINEKRYDADVDVIIDELIKDGTVHIPGEGENYEMNKEFQIAEFKTLRFLDDMQIDHFEWKGKQMPIQQLLTPLMGISFNKKWRYEKMLEKQNGDTWFVKYAKLVAENVQKNHFEFPFTLLSIEEYLGMYKNASMGDFHTELIDLFSFQFNDKKFQWGQKCFDVFRKPFIRIDNNLICPTMFLGRNEWFYSFINAALENLALPKNIELQKKVSDLMEKFVEELFENKIRIREIHTNAKGKNGKGDIDIWVESDKDILLIQLKRTKLRPTLAGAFYEFIQTDLHAVAQISECEIDNPENKRVTRWIVSTSYERCMERINGILKINYYDLIYNLRTVVYTDLGQFINHIENDEDMRKYVKNAVRIGQDAQMSFGLPLSVQSPNAYRICLPTRQEENNEEFVMFNKALELQKAQKTQKAIRILQHLSERCPNDCEVWYALANMYAEEKLYEKAFDCYETALRIVPDDPWIIRNYAITCNEAKKFDKYFELLQIRKIKYWFLDFS